MPGHDSRLESPEHNINNYSFTCKKVNKFKYEGIIAKHKTKKKTLKMSNKT